MIKLSRKIVNSLKKKQLKISFAESCTGGLLSSSITSINGSSKVFSLGLVTYSDLAKINLLNVPKSVLKKHGSVSHETCLSMVNNLSKISKSKVCVSITGIAGPSGGTKQKPVGLVYIGIKRANKVTINRFFFKKRGRYNIQKAAVKKSLDLILRSIK